LTFAASIAWITTMTAESGPEQLRAAALEAIISSLREAVVVDRCTLRLEVAGEFFPVVHESRRSPAATLIGDRNVSLQGQPVVEAILAGAEQVVQADTATASDDPAFGRMLVHYGGLGAQIVTPVREGATLLGIISLHHLGGPREWSPDELTLARAAADLVARLVADPAPACPEAGTPAATAPEDHR
jgi:GAF domain-containing protein